MTTEQQRIVNLETRFAELFLAYQSLTVAVDRLYRVVETREALDSIELTATKH
jgi:hypothetical protein